MSTNRERVSKKGSSTIRTAFFAYRGAFKRKPPQKRNKKGSPERPEAAFCLPELQASPEKTYIPGIISELALCMIHSEPTSTMATMRIVNAKAITFQRCSDERSMCRK